MIVLVGGTFRKYLGLEDGVLMSGISAFRERTPESSLTSSTIRRHSEREPATKPSPESDHPAFMISDFQPVKL